MDLSVVVASCKNPMGLYLTAFAAIEQLSKTSLSWEVILACDEGAPEKWEKIPSVTCLRLKTGSPQGTGTREFVRPRPTLFWSSKITSL